MIEQLPFSLNMLLNHAYTTIQWRGLACFEQLTTAFP